MMDVLIDGAWRAADAESEFYAENPNTGKKIDRAFPVSRWSDCDAALSAAVKAAKELETTAPERIADFLEHYAAGLDASAEQLAEAAHEETALPFQPRLKDVELPRTSDQLRQAARAAREGSWRQVIVDSQRNIRLCRAPIGPVVVIGPNNFPFAYNGVAGGDFAAAIAAGNPVIGKAHPLHPYTTYLLAKEAHKAVLASGLPAATVQMLYHVSNETGLKLAGDPRVGATGFTGSKAGGLALKRAADEAGKPVYLEMSSLNPVIFLPQGMQQSGSQWASQLADSCTAGAGQFCTRPNLVFMAKSEAAESFLQELAGLFSSRTPAPMLSGTGRERLHESIEALRKAGAELVTGGTIAPGDGYRYADTLLRVSAEKFIAAPHEFLREAFGNEVMAVVAAHDNQLLEALTLLDGSLTASVYSAESGADDALYARVAPVLRRKAGRLLNDKMPTGVAVTAAMNHGGPYPATGHPGFTAVGIPTAIARFTELHCYDNVREERLPPFLRGDGLAQ
jgi:2,5-dioxopentanoate dehydrogenase